MHKIFLTKISLITILLTFPGIIQAQSFGFGCLGFVGGYGGYSYQKYQPDMLNNFVDRFNSSKSGSLSSELPKFGTSQGFRVGINFFRANFTNFFLTAKGFYQSTHEENSAVENANNQKTDYEYDLHLRNWGIGVDFGITIYKALRWKIVDGSLNINSARLTETINNGNNTQVTKYNNEKTKVGYSVGTGLVVDIIADYISLEGMAGYSQLQIDKMITDNGVEFNGISENTLEPEPFLLVQSGGFTAVIQLNIGFPL